MKLLIITAIQEFEKNIKQMLKNADINIYSYKDVTGFRDLSEEAVESNWFASDMNYSESVFFYAFVEKEKSDKLFELVNTFNANLKTLSKIHVVVLKVENSN